MKRILSFPLALLLLVIFTSCDDDPFRGPDFSTVPEPYSISGIERQVSPDGLITYELAEGSGPLEATVRDFVGYRYTLRLLNGRIVESSWANGSSTPRFNQVRSHIEGFRNGLIGMKEGGVKVLIIPPDLAYGNNSNSNLQDDTLRFDLELVNIAY